jgi:hypothetical protein
MRWLAPLTLAVVTVMAAASAPDAAAALELTVLPDRLSYRSGQPIGLTLSVANRSSETVQLSFRTSQRFDFIIRDERGVERWRASSDEMFAQATGEERLPPGTVLVYRAQCSAKLAPGIYTVEAAVVAEQRQVTSVTIRID